MLKKCTACLSLLFLLPSCAAQKTVFFSDPPGAQITVDGEIIGETPCEYEYKAGAEKKYRIAVHKESYQSVEDNITTDSVDKESRNKWLVAGLIWSPLWLGTMFTRKLKDSYHFILTKINNAGETSPEEDRHSQQLSQKNESDPRPLAIARGPS